MIPLKHSQSLYKGSDFVMKFRLKNEGNYLTFDDITITITASANGVNVFSYATGESPLYVTVDATDNNLVTIRIPAAITETFSDPKIYYEVDVTDADGYVTRWIIGTITVYEAAA